MANFDADVSIKIDADTNNAERALSSLEKSVDRAFKSPQASVKQLGIQADKVQHKLEAVNTKMKTLQNVEIHSSGYKRLERQLTELTARAVKSRDVLKELSLRGKDASNSTRFKEEANALRNYVAEIKRVKKDMQDMRDSGKAVTGWGWQTKTYQNLARQQAILVQQSAILNQRIRDAENSATRLSNRFKSLFGGVAGVFKRIGRAIKDNITRHNNDSAKSFKHLLRQVLKYGLGIRSLFLLYKKLRQYGKEAFKDMAIQYPEINAQLSDLVSTFSQMTHSIATAFQPLLSVVLPVLNAIMNAAIAAANAIGSFFAALTGQGFIYKAIKQQKNFAGAVGGTGSAAKEAKEELAEYDKLLVIDQDKGGGGGGGGGGADGGSIFFEKAPLNEGAVNLLEKIKDAWANSDFKPLGEEFGRKFTDALNSIQWDGIRSVALKLGQSLAQFLNGFISPESIGAVGRTIANAFNTALDLAYGFISKFDFTNLGVSLANGVNEFFKTFDFKELGETIYRLIGGALDAATAFFTETDFELIGEKIGEFLGQIKIKDLVTKMYNLAKAIINALIDAIKGLHKEQPLLTDIGGAIIGLIAIAKIFNFGKELAGLAGDIVNLLIANFPKVIKLAGIGLTVAGLYIAEIESGSTVTDLILDALGAVSLYAGLRMLGVPLGLSLKITAVKLAWDIGTDIGTFIMEHIYSALGDTEGASYYANFSWKDFIADVFDAAKSGDLVNGIKLWWQDIVDEVQLDLTDIFDWWGDESEGLFGPLIELFDPDNNYFSDLIDHLISSGKEMWNDLWEGFWGAVTDIGSWIADEFNEHIVQPIKDFFGISSPSKLMADIGGWMMEGLLNGLTEFWTQIEEWVLGAVQWIEEQFGPVGDVIKTAVAGVSAPVNEVGNVIVDIAKQEQQRQENSKKAKEEADKRGVSTWKVIGERTGNFENKNVADIEKSAKHAFEALEKVKESFAELPKSSKKAYNGVTKAFSDSASWAQNTADGISKGFDKMPNEVETKFKGAYTKSTDEFKGINQWARNIERDTVTGFNNLPSDVEQKYRSANKQGRAQFDGATDWAKTVVSKVDLGFTGLPSQVQARYKKAYTDSISEFADSMQWAQGRSDAIGIGFNGLAGLVQARFRDSYSKGTAEFNNSTNWARGVANNINSGLSGLPSAIQNKFKTGYAGAQTESNNFVGWLNKQNFTANFKIITPSQNWLQGQWNGLASVWKDQNAEFTVNANGNVGNLNMDRMQRFVDATNVVINQINDRLNTLKQNKFISGVKTLSPISMPARRYFLAKGGVIPPNHKFLAMLGDQTQGTNIETPLNTMVEAFEIALANGAGAGASTVNVNIDGRQVAQVVWDANERRYKQTGRS